MYPTVAGVQNEKNKAVERRSAGLMRAGPGTRLFIALAALVVCSPVLARAANLQMQHDFRIPAQSLDTALLAFSDQASVQVLMWAGGKSDAQSPGVMGERSAIDALRAILGDTGLAFKEIDTETVAIVDGKEAGTTKLIGYTGGGGRLRLAQADSPAPGRGTGSSSQEQRASDQKPSATFTANPQSLDKLEEVLVTGTHIRGIENSATPLLVYDRDDIQRSGLGTTEDFVRTIPQNFGGGNSSLTIGSILGGEGSNLNYGMATGMNLRGLGNLSTLTLINGRRPPAAGVGNVVDISLIPLSAIERVEIMTDGASAIYGSDAVGGVVNFITRRDFEGVEVHGRYGSVTSGSHAEYEAGVTGGTHWGSGSAMVTYEYENKTRLDSADRSFTELVARPTDLLVDESKHGILATIRQSAGDRVELALDGFFGKHSTDSSFNNPPPYVNVTTTTSEQYGLNADAKVDIGGEWRVDFAAGYGRNTTDYTVIIGDGLFRQDYHGRVESRSFDATVDGPVAMLPGGAIRLALGGTYRRESYEKGDVGQKRDVTALFGELFIPLIGPANASRLAQRLELTLAARYEDYENVGSSSDPKVGLYWGLTPSFGLRGSYGSSFRAPLLSEQNNRILYAPFYFPDPASLTGMTGALLLQGGNPDLGPEQADTWSVGFDFNPDALPGFSAAITYFNIDFQDRIANAYTGNQLFSVFLTPENYPAYGDYLILNPALATVQAYYASPYFQNQGRVPPERVGAIVNNQIANVAHREEDGLDVTMTYAVDTSIGRFDTRLSASHLLTMRDQFTPAASFVSVLNTPYYPVDTRGRLSVGWQREQLSTTIFLNYVSGYRDNRINTAGPIPSWTTVDLSLAYALPKVFESTSIALSVQNLFDEDPPYVANPLNLNYDATNASPLGRLVAVQLRAKF